jgi:hypothetical protein
MGRRVRLMTVYEGWLKLLALISYTCKILEVYDGISKVTISPAGCVDY